LLSLGVAHVWNDYGPGTHSWPYWQRDLSEAMPSLMSSLAPKKKARKKRRHHATHASAALTG
jgi:hypothetical protein